MDAHTVATTGSGILQAVNTTLSTVRTALDLAKETKDHKLKTAIGEALDSVVDLKARLMDSEDEIRNLKARLAERDAIVGPVAPFGYFYSATDAEKATPLCPQCVNEKRHKYLLQSEEWEGGLRRYCPSPACQFSIQESSAPAGPVRLGSMSRRSYSSFR